MRLILSILIVFNIVVSYSQCEVTEFDYSVTLNKNDDYTERMFREYLQNAEFKSEFVTFSLFVNEKEMKFESKKSSIISDEDYLSILDMSDIDGIYYRKNNSDLFYREPTHTVLGKDIITTKKIITDWEIVNDEKVINGYKCYKAICNLKVDLGDGTINSLYPIVAWYCPDIKYSYGPKGYGGLPGLIFELELRLVTFKIKNIVTEKLNVDISIPSNKRIITEDEFYTIIDEAIKKNLKN